MIAFSDRFPTFGPSRVRAFAFALAIAFSASACYRYRPAELRVVPPGDYVRLYVTPQATTESSELFSFAADQVVSGRLMRADSSNLLMRLPVAGRQEGFATEILVQDVSIPWSQILQMQRREINLPATALLTVGGTVVITGMAILIMTGGGQGGAGPDDRPVGQLAPSIRISLPAFFLAGLGRTSFGEPPE